MVPMKSLSRIPRLLRLLLLLGFFQAIAADSSTVPTRIREPVAQSSVSSEPPGGQVFPDQPELIGQVDADRPGEPPNQVVRVLAVAWEIPAPGSRIDRLTCSGLSPPVHLS